MATLTTNKNFLSPVGFQFKVNANEFPNTEYFCTAVTLPGISLSESNVPYRGVNIAMTGDRLNFDELAIRFNITEDMDNYIEMFNWMHNIIKDPKGESYKFDATLSILTSHNNVVKEVEFKGVFPTSMEPIQFDAQAESVEFVQMEIGFGYTYFEFK